MRLLLPVLAICLAGLVWFQTTSPRDGCEEIRVMMPPEFAGFVEQDCNADINGQARARLTVIVPAADVVATANRLSETYGMGALRFVCCGYEPTNGQSAQIDLPEALFENGTIARGGPETFTSLSIHMATPGLAENAPNDAQPDADFLALGDVPATLYFALLDV